MSYSSCCGGGGIFNDVRYHCGTEAEDAPFEVLETKFFHRYDGWYENNKTKSTDKNNTADYYRAAVRPDIYDAYVDVYDVFDAIAEDAEEVTEEAPVVWDWHTGKITESLSMSDICSNITKEGQCGCNEKRGNIRGMFFVPSNNSDFEAPELDNLKSLE